MASEEKPQRNSRRRACARKQATTSLMTAKPGKINDIHGWMRVKPEHVLEEHGVAAVIGVENANLEEALKADQQ